MNELIREISQKTGLPEAQARQAADVALNFIKGKLPAPLAAQVDSALKGGSKMDIGDIASKATGIFGGGKQ